MGYIQEMRRFFIKTLNAIESGKELDEEGFHKGFNDATSGLQEVTDDEKEAAIANEFIKFLRATALSAQSVLMGIDILQRADISASRILSLPQKERGNAIAEEVENILHQIALDYFPDEIEDEGSKEEKEQIHSILLTRIEVQKQMRHAVGVHLN